MKRESKGLLKILTLLLVGFIIDKGLPGGWSWRAAALFIIDNWTVFTVPFIFYFAIVTIEAPGDGSVKSMFKEFKSEFISTSVFILISLFLSLYF